MPVLCKTGNKGGEELHVQSLQRTDPPASDDRGRTHRVRPAPSRRPPLHDRVDTHKQNFLGIQKPFYKKGFGPRRQSFWEIRLVDKNSPAML